MIIINPLFTRNFTQVECEDKEEQKFNAPHHFIVKETDPVSLVTGKTVAMVNFQEGPIKECGINGISNEDALLMVLTRLESFQDTDWACKENEMAITKIQEAVMWLRKRTLGREIKGIEGTSNKDIKKSSKGRIGIHRLITKENAIELDAQIENLIKYDVEELDVVFTSEIPVLTQDIFSEGVELLIQLLNSKDYKDKLNIKKEYRPEVWIKEGK